MNTQPSPRWPWWAETALVATVTFLAAQNLSAPNGGHYLRPAVGFAALAGLSLALRHRWPLAVGAVTAAAAGFLGLLEPLLVSLFHLASRGRALAAVGFAAAALAVNALARPAMNLWTPRFYGPALLPLIALVLGLWAGSRRRLVDTLAGQVERLRTERELRAEAARLSERAAIAAEMHDVLAHRLSLIALHTGVLRTRKEQLPPAVADRVDVLRTASTDALADLRDVLGALRDPGGTDTGRSAPAPALREVDELIGAAREAGQRVELVSEGDPDTTPAAHRLAVFRLVQESLTNARKHAAPGAPVRVRVRYGPPATTVEVTNAVAVRPGDTVRSGFGLVGLRERVETLGGRLRAGPRGADAWHLEATIPARAVETAAGGGATAPRTGEAPPRTRPAPDPGPRRLDPGDRDPEPRQPDLGTRHSDPESRHPDLGTRRLAPGTKHPGPDPEPRQPDLGTRQPDSEPRHPDLGTRRLAPGTKHPGPEPEPGRPDPEPTHSDPGARHPDPEPESGHPDPEPTHPDPGTRHPDPEPEPGRSDPEPTHPDPGARQTDPEPTQPDPGTRHRP